MMHDVMQQAKPTFGSPGNLFNAHAKDEVIVGQVIKEVYSKCLYQKRTIIVRLLGCRSFAGLRMQLPILERWRRVLCGWACGLATLCLKYGTTIPIFIAMT